MRRGCGESAGKRVVERGEGLKNPCTGGIFGNKSLKGMNSLRLRLRSDSMPFLTRFIPLILSPLLHEVLSPLPLFLFGGGSFAGDCGESAGKRVVERGEGLKNPCTGGIFGNKSLKGMNSLRLRLRSDSMPFLTRFIPLILSPLLHEVLSLLPLFLFGGGPFAGDCGESAGGEKLTMGCVWISGGRVGKVRGLMYFC